LAFFNSLNSKARFFSRAFRTVFSNPKYSVLAIAVALVVFIGVNFLVNWRLISGFVLGDFPLQNKTAVLSGLLQGSLLNNTSETFVSFLVVALLIGANISLFAYRIRHLRLDGMAGASGVIGGFLGLFAAGCTACTLSLVAFFGFAGLFALLPFGGIEVWALGIIVLVASIYWNSKSICGVC